MQYKTIILEFLQQRPWMYEQLRQERRLLKTVEMFSGELKTNHEAWMETLAATNPDSDPNQIANEAMEVALRELEECLSTAWPADKDETLSLDQAMAFIRTRSSRG